MSPRTTRRMVRVRHSAMSFEFQLNSLFHSVLVKGDYELSKKNEILVDLFLSTLFHAVPLPTTSPSSIPILSSNQLCPLLSFFFYSSPSAHRSSQSRGQVRGHLAPPRCWAWATWQQRPLLFWSVARCQTFTFTPSPLALLWRKPLQGCFNGGLWALGSLPQRRLDAVIRRVTLGTHGWGKKVGNRGGDAPLLWLAALHGHHIFDITGWWAASFGCRNLLS